MSNSVTELLGLARRALKEETIPELRGAAKACEFVALAALSRGEELPDSVVSTFQDLLVLDKMS